MRKSVYCRGKTGQIEMLIEADSAADIEKTARIVCEKYGWTLLKGENDLFRD